MCNRSLHKAKYQRRPKPLSCVLLYTYYCIYSLNCNVFPAEVISFCSSHLRCTFLMLPIAADDMNSRWEQLREQLPDLIASALADHEWYVNDSRGTVVAVFCVNSPRNCPGNADLPSQIRPLRGTCEGVLGEVCRHSRIG